jgi:hypothetical protein
MNQAQAHGLSFWLFILSGALFARLVALRTSRASGTKSKAFWPDFNRRWQCVAQHPQQVCWVATLCSQSSAFAALARGKLANAAIDVPDFDSELICDARFGDVTRARIILTLDLVRAGDAVAPVYDEETVRFHSRPIPAAILSQHTDEIVRRPTLSVGGRVSVARAFAPRATRSPAIPATGL